MKFDDNLLNLKSIQNELINRDNISKKLGKKKVTLYKELTDAQIYELKNEI